MIRVCLHIRKYMQIFQLLDQELITHITPHIIQLLLDDPLQKGPRLRRFKSDRDEIWHDCCSCNFALTDGIRFSI